MAGIRRVGESRPRLARVALALVAGLAALTLSMSIASASSPTHGEYSLNTQGAQTPGGPKDSGGSVGGSQGGSALPVLIAAFVVIGGGSAAVVYFRRGRSEAPS